MNYSTVYVGMDVHKETFSLCCVTIHDRFSHFEDYRVQEGCFASCDMRADGKDAALGGGSGS